MHLFDQAGHEPLTTTPWDAERARGAIEQIVTRTIESHERGGSDHSLWTGAAGTLWAFDRLGYGIGEAGLLDAYDARREDDGPGLMTGETGVVLASWHLEPSSAKEDRLYELVSANMDNPSHELFDGSPGTMLAALHLFERTGDARWSELWCRCADVLLEQFRPDPELGCRIWIQYRRGRMIRSIGAAHGFASNVHTLLRGAALLGEPRTAELQRAAAETTVVLALEEDGLVNWPTAADSFWAGDFPIRVQWCHGAPGLVTSLAALPHTDTTDRLLAAAGELTWRAGPLTKGPGLCHGTAGNGCAFLALHGRTGDATWLLRARAFAMHSLEQAETTRTRPSLWTGEIAWRCTFEPASTAGTGCPSSTFSRPRRESRRRFPRCGRQGRRTRPSVVPTPGRSAR
jgi:hypothetical protein